MLTPDHGLQIVPEDHLGVIIVFRLHHIHGLMGVDGAEARFGQLLGHAGAKNGCSIQTQNGVHGGIIDKMRNQLRGGVLRLVQTGFLLSDVDVIVDVAVVGGEVALGDAQGGLSVASGQVGQFWHKRFLLNK